MDENQRSRRQRYTTARARENGTLAQARMIAPSPMQSRAVRPIGDECNRPERRRSLRVAGQWPVPCRCPGREPSRAARWPPECFVSICPLRWSRRRLGVWVVCEAGSSAV